MKLCYYGVDLHARNFNVHLIYEQEGKVIGKNSIKFSIADIEDGFIKMLRKNDYVCLEATTSAFAFAKMIRPYVKEVIIINPFDFRALYMSGKKTDKIDARRLSERLYLHIISLKNGFKDNFPKVYIPEDPIVELRCLFSTYEVLKKQIVSLKNRIHSLLKQNLVLYESKDLFPKFVQIVEESDMKDIYKKQCVILKRQIISIEQELQEITDMILEIGYDNYKDEITILMSQMGISFFTACAIISDIADINRFKSAKRLCSYLRSGMRVDASDKTIHIGKINKKARKLSFKMILQGLQHTVNYNPRFAEFKERKLKGKSNGKVRCALVRKTIVGIFYMLKNKELWQYCNDQTYQKKLKEMERRIGKIKFQKAA